jgi:hypothetical protein
MVENFDFFGYSINLLNLLFFMILIIIFIFGQNFQTKYALRQINRSWRIIRGWRNFGFKLIHRIISPICSSTISSQDIDSFIEDMLEFFVIRPVKLDSPYFPKLNYLLMRREKRFRELIKQFLPNINILTLATLTSLFSTTAEIENIYRKVRHSYLMGKKTKSTWFILQNAAEMTQILLTAQAYTIALDSFTGNIPIGDSIGPLTIQRFVQETNNNSSNNLLPVQEITEIMIAQTVNFEERTCICLRANGPASVVGNPGISIQKIVQDHADKNRVINLIITIDSYLRMEGEDPGSVALGLGPAIGGLQEDHPDKYMIESIAIDAKPPIPIESIICRESLQESVSPISEEIKSAVPKIIRLLKQIIRSQSNASDTVIILGVGNALGVEK